MGRIYIDIQSIDRRWFGNRSFQCIRVWDLRTLWKEDYTSVYVRDVIMFLCKCLQREVHGPMCSPLYCYHYECMETSLSDGHPPTLERSLSIQQDNRSQGYPRKRNTCIGSTCLYTLAAEIRFKSGYPTTCLARIQKKIKIQGCRESCRL